MAAGRGTRPLSGPRTSFITIDLTTSATTTRRRSGGS